jgi:hypothetical protein
LPFSTFDVLSNKNGLISRSAATHADASRARNSLRLSLDGGTIWRIVNEGGDK